MPSEDIGKYMPSIQSQLLELHFLEIRLGETFVFPPLELSLFPVSEAG